MGFVHNTFLLHRPQKTVLRSPLTLYPKPVWLPTHRRPDVAAWRLLDLYRKPAWRQLARLICQAVRG